MTWHSFLSLGTLESRHLLAAYVVVWIIQGGYFARLLWQWRRTRPGRP